MPSGSMFDPRPKRGKYLPAGRVSQQELRERSLPKWKQDRDRQLRKEAELFGGNELHARFHRLGLIDDQKKITEDGKRWRDAMAAKAPKGRDPGQLLSHLERGFLDLDGNITEDGKFYRAGFNDRDALIRGPKEDWFRWNKLGGEADWAKRNPGAGAGEITKTLATKTIPNAAKFVWGERSNMPDPIGLLIPDIGKDEQQVRRAEWSRESMRSPVVLSDGMRLIGAKAFGSQEDVWEAKQDMLKHQLEIDDLSTAQASSAFLGAVDAVTMGVINHSDEELAQEIQNVKESEQRLVAEHGKDYVEKQKEIGGDGGELTNLFDLVTEAAVGGAGYALRAGSWTLSKAARLQKKVVEMEARKGLLIQQAKVAKELQQGRKVARRRADITLEIADLSKKIDETKGVINKMSHVAQRTGTAARAGKVGRAVRGGALKYPGAFARWSGDKLESLNKRLGGTVDVGRTAALVAGGTAATGPVGAGLGLAAGILSKGSVLKRVGEFVETMGEQWTRRRQTMPYWRRVSNSLKGKGNRLARLAGGMEDFAKPVALTGDMAKAALRGTAAEMPFSYIAAGGEEGWFNDAIAEGTLFGMGGRAMGVIGHTAGIPGIGSPKDFKALAEADALELRKILPPSQKKLLDGMAPSDRRALGIAAAQHPDLIIEINDKLVTPEGKQGDGGYNATEGTIVINPKSPNPLAPILSHEVKHHLDEQAGADVIVEEFIGEGGLFRDENGELTDEFKALKADYERNYGGEISDRDAALEISAEIGVPGLSNAYRSGLIQKMVQKGPLARAITNSLMNVPAIAKGFLLKNGVLFDQKGNPIRGTGVYGRHAHSPAVAKMLEAHVRANAGLKSSEGLRKANERRNRVRRSTHFEDDTVNFQYDENGKVLLDEDGRPIRWSKEAIDARAKGGETMAAVAARHGIEPEVDGKGQKSYRFSPEQWDEVIKDLEKDGGYNSIQLDVLRKVKDAKDNKSTMGSVFMYVYDKVWNTNRKTGKKSVPRRGFERELKVGIPWDVTTADNGHIIIQDIDRDALRDNVLKAAGSKLGKRLYGGDSAKVWRDVSLMAENHREGKPNEARSGGPFNEDQMNLLNAVFGNVAKGHLDKNPLLEKSSAFPNMVPTIRSRRLDRISKIREVGDRVRVSFDWERVKERSKPTGQRLQQSGESDGPPQAKASASMNPRNRSDAGAVDDFINSAPEVNKKDAAVRFAPTRAKRDLADNIFGWLEDEANALDGLGVIADIDERMGQWLRTRESQDAATGKINKRRNSDSIRDYFREHPDEMSRLKDLHAANRVGMLGPDGELAFSPMEDERHAKNTEESRYRGFGRSLSQMYLDRLNPDLYNRIQAKMSGAVEIAFDAATAQGRELPSGPLKIEDVTFGAPVSRIEGEAKDFRVQPALRTADKTEYALNTNSACPQFVIGNRGCWGDGCYLTQQGAGGNVINLFQRAMYAGELLQLSKAEVSKINATGGMRVNGLGDTTADNVQQIQDFLRHAKKVGLKVKMITKQELSFKVLEDLYLAGTDVSHVVLQPSIDHYWTPVKNDLALEGSGARELAGRDKDDLARFLADDDGDRVEAVYEQYGREVKKIDGEWYRKDGLSWDQYDALRSKYKHVPTIPRVVVGSVSEILDSAMHHPNCIVTIMHGKLGEGVRSAMPGKQFNFNNSRHHVSFDEKAGKLVFTADESSPATLESFLNGKHFTDGERTRIAETLGQDLPDQEVSLVMRKKKDGSRVPRLKIKPKPGAPIKTKKKPRKQTQGHKAVEDFVNSDRFTVDERRMIAKNMKDQICCQENDSVDACAGCASHCAARSIMSDAQTAAKAYPWTDGGSSPEARMGYPPEGFFMPHPTSTPSPDAALKAMREEGSTP